MAEVFTLRSHCVGPEGLGSAKPKVVFKAFVFLTVAVSEAGLSRASAHSNGLFGGHGNWAYLLYRNCLSGSRGLCDLSCLLPTPPEVLSLQGSGEGFLVSHNQSESESASVELFFVTCYQEIKKT